jgi:hypothetical protein
MGSINLRLNGTLAFRLPPSMPQDYGSTDPGSAFHHDEIGVCVKVSPIAVGSPTSLAHTLPG